MQNALPLICKYTTALFSKSYSANSLKNYLLFTGKNCLFLSLNNCFGSFPCVVTPSELCERRKNLISSLQRQTLDFSNNSKTPLSLRQSVIIIPSGFLTYTSHDVPIPFRQNTNFYYLTGYSGSVPSLFVLYPRESSNGLDLRSALFLQDRSKEASRWEGSFPSARELKAALYIDEILSIDQLETFSDSFLRPSNTLWIPYPLEPWSTRHDPMTSFCAPSFASFVTKLRNISLSEPSRVRDIKPLLHKLRSIKSTYEQNEIRRACDIGAQAMLSAMRFSHFDAAADENSVWGLLENEVRRLGARCLAYPPVIAGGSRANVIHYTANDQPLRSTTSTTTTESISSSSSSSFSQSPSSAQQQQQQQQHDRELLLVDNGAELYSLYSSDITRAWPLHRSASFSEPQRRIYEAVLHVQQTLIEQCRPGLAIRDLYVHMNDLLAQVMRDIGLISERDAADKIKVQQLVYHYCPHNVGHHLGLEVHDVHTLSDSEPLAPGAVITIEPGIYVPLEESESPGAPPELRGLAIRIEDDILITESGCEVLTSKVPKSPSEIQKILCSSSVYSK